MPSQHRLVHLSPIFSDFQEELLATLKSSDEAVPSTLRLRRKWANSVLPRIVERIKTWVGSTAELAQIVCQAVVESASGIDETHPERSVDRIVKDRILNDWQGGPAAKHLSEVVGSLLQKENKDLQLLRYLKVLQRESIPLPHSAEQQREYQALLEIGLIVAEKNMLKVSNAIYANVFDTDWIEKQLPGITRPVSIKKSSDDINHDSQQPSAASGLYSKLAVFACCIAVLGAVVSAYRRESINEASAKSASRQTMSSLQETADTPALEANAPQANADDRGIVTPRSTSPSAVPYESTIDVKSTDRQLFDQGVEHATNNRWLPMVREFCQLSPGSTYTTLAQRQLENWVKLYKEDIEIAQKTFTQEEGGECSMISTALANNN